MREIYQSLEKQIGNTPLLKFPHLLPNNNILYVKLECENPFGYNHYIRVYFALFKYYEKKGLITPGQRVYDFTSGIAGIAMVALGTKLGYSCEVAMPAGGEKAREKGILEWIPKKQLHLTDALLYVDGAPAFTRKFLERNRDVFFMNHSMTMTKNGPKINKVSINACSKVADEIAKKTKSLDIFIAISGNGTTQYGYGRRLKKLFKNLQIIGCEPFESGFTYDKLYPGHFEEKYGMNLEMRKQFSRHRLPGTSYRVRFPVPALDVSIPLLFDERLVWDSQTKEEYKKIVGNPTPNDAIFWDKDIPKELNKYGRTTWAGYSVAKTLAIKTKNQKYLIVAYDKHDRYDK